MDNNKQLTTVEAYERVLEAMGDHYGFAPDSDPRFIVYFAAGIAHALAEGRIPCNDPCTVATISALLDIAHEQGFD